jgi:hypothetical protein
MTTRIKAVCEGVLFDGLVDCYVLDGGLAIISQRGGVRALTGGTDHGRLGQLVARLPARFASLAAGPVFDITLPAGGTASGRDAEWFVDVLQAYVDAHFAGELHSAQEPLARNAARILSALGKVGIVALIHEATGYEAHREQGALGRLFSRIFRGTPAPWERMFQDPLIVALCKLDGITWTGGRHPRHLASTQEKIYSMILGSDVGAEMQRRNPQPARGKNHHQTLVTEAQQDLRLQLAIVESIANQSRDKSDFWNRMERQYRRGFLQLDLDPEPT